MLVKYFVHRKISEKSQIKKWWRWKILYPRYQKPPSHHHPKNQPFLTATLVYLFTA